MPELQRNAFKHALAQGKLQIGLWSSLCSNIAAEVIADSGFDWVLLDSPPVISLTDSVILASMADSVAFFRLRATAVSTGPWPPC